MCQSLALWLFRQRLKIARYVSVNTFSTKVLIGDTMFTSPNADVVVQVTWRSSRLQGKGSTLIVHLLSYFKALNIGSNPWPPAIKRSTDWTSRVAVKGLLSFKSTPRRSLWFQNRAMSRLDNELSLESRPLSRLSTHNTSSESNVVVAWLERFEDRAHFPVDELLMEFDLSQNVGHSLREKNTVVIFIHHLRSGLYWIHIRSTFRYIGPFLLLFYILTLNFS